VYQGWFEPPTEMKSTVPPRPPEPPSRLARPFRPFQQKRFPPRRTIPSRVIQSWSIRLSARPRRAA